MRIGGNRRENRYHYVNDKQASRVISGISGKPPRLLCGRIVLFRNFFPRSVRRFSRSIITRAKDNLYPPSTMLLAAELDSLQSFAEHSYLGKGEMVDLGCWLGGSTLGLANGLVKNQRVSKKKKRIHAFDDFVWESWMADTFEGSKLAKRIKEGDSFLRLFKRTIKQRKALIEVYPADLNFVSRFPMDIEYLFIDVMKSWNLANVVVKIFFPKLVPNLSLIHHQDFNHFYTPWIHLLMFRFRGNFRLKHIVKGTGSVIFELVAPFTSEALNRNYSFESFSEDEYEAAFEYSCQPLGVTEWPMVEASRIMGYIHQEKWDQAYREFEKLLAKHGTTNDDVRAVGQILSNHSAIG